LPRTPQRDGLALVALRGFAAADVGSGSRAVLGTQTLPS
jgi:hypothetical protein